jgi:hypothetical protein
VPHVPHVCCFAPVLATFYVMWMVVVAEVCRSAPKSTSQKVRDRARWSKLRIASPSANFLSPPRQPDERSRKYYHYYDNFDLGRQPPTDHLIATESSFSYHTMATALAVGVGVAAAAFFVRPSTIDYAPKRILTSYRVVPVSSLFAGTVAVPVLSAKHSTRVDSRRR